MEHCISSVLIQRKQSYLDNIKPQYNILTMAGNRKGFIHSEASKELQRVSKAGDKVSEETQVVQNVSHSEARKKKK